MQGFLTPRHLISSSGDYRVFFAIENAALAEEKRQDIQKIQDNSFLKSLYLNPGTSKRVLAKSKRTLTKTRIGSRSDLGSLNPAFLKLEPALIPDL
jgi:hypothetical protein